MALSLPGYQFTKKDRAQVNPQEPGDGLDSRNGNLQPEGRLLAVGDIAACTGLSPKKIRYFANQEIVDLGMKWGADDFRVRWWMLPNYLRPFPYRFENEEEDR
jgi:hypothetical protein